MALSTPQFHVLQDPSLEYERDFSIALGYS